MNKNIEYGHVCIDKRIVNFWELQDTVNRRRIWISSTGVIIPGLYV